MCEVWEHESACAARFGLPLSYAVFITKTRLYDFDPIKPNFDMVKLGFTGVFIIILISAQKHRMWVLVRTASGISAQKHRLWVLVRTASHIDCGYSLEPPRRGSSNEYPQSMFLAESEAVLTSTHNLCFWAEIRKLSEFFIWKFSVLEVKFLYIFE